MNGKDFDKIIQFCRENDLTFSVEYSAISNDFEMVCSDVFSDKMIYSKRGTSSENFLRDWNTDRMIEKSPLELRVIKENYLIKQQLKDAEEVIRELGREEILGYPENEMVEKYWEKYERNT